MEFQIIDLHQINQKKTVSQISQCLDLWRQVYEPILHKNKETLDLDHFLRSRYLSILHGSNKIFAFCLHNPFLVQDSFFLENSYFKYCTPYAKAMIFETTERILSLEWLTANPLFRGKISGINYNEYLLSLTFHWMKENRFSAMMGYSRTDYKADKAAEKFGASAIDTVQRHGIECKIMLAYSNRIITHPDPEQAQVIYQIYKTTQTNDFQEQAA
jgi:hypothetical protein